MVFDPHFDPSFCTAFQRHPNRTCLSAAFCSCLLSSFISSCCSCFPTFCTPHIILCLHIVGRGSAFSTVIPSTHVQGEGGLRPPQHPSPTPVGTDIPQAKPPSPAPSNLTSEGVVSIAQTVPGVKEEVGCKDMLSCYSELVMFLHLEACLHSQN